MMMKYLLLIGCSAATGFGRQFCLPTRLMARARLFSFGLDTPQFEFMNDLNASVPPNCPGLVRIHNFYFEHPASQSVWIRAYHS